MNICVVGSGYVGLVTGACLADFGMNVTGVDKDAGKIERLKAGEIPIFEPGLATLVRKNMEAGRLHFTTELGPSIEAARAVFIAVGTPPLPDGSADLTFIRQVAESIGSHLNGYKAVVTKSTVPTGTGQMVEQIVAETSGSRDFAVVSNPEFLREGSAIEDFLRPDRVVIGTRDPQALEIMHDIYAPLKVANVPFVDCDVETAELIKYASNGFLATKISFINEVATLCEAYGADVEVVSRGMGLDNRIGPRFLNPGPGFGGSCFPKDTRAVAQIAQSRGLNFRIIEAVLEANEATKARMVVKVREAFDGDLAGKTLAVLGLSFKPNTDDIRESPALPLIDGLLADGATVRAYDPEAMDACRAERDDIVYCQDAYDAAEGADAVVIVTEWNQFRALDAERLRSLLTQPLIIDLRNIYEPAKVAAAGFRYVSIGRPVAEPVANDA
ncbi:MAG: UDP-glucose/GDP-mannose dehydrogenase family protein [Acidobacteriota bacterium]